nr:PASTA domain-containing protein [Micromonospora sp. DSM 115978]
VRQEASDEWAAGQVVRTEPEAGAQVEVGTQVVLVVSSGPSTVVVPTDLEGKTFDEAVASLQALGLTANRVDVAERGADAGEVVGVENAGGQVNRGSAVTLYVATGTNQGVVIVPDIEGLGVWEAEARLRQEGLNPQRVNGGLLPGDVVAQNPEAGSRV